MTNDQYKPLRPSYSVPSTEYSVRSTASQQRMHPSPLTPHHSLPIRHSSFVIRHCLCIVQVLLFATLAIADPPDSVLQIERDRIAVIAKASEAFIAVFANEGNGGGSGVVISPDGYALTN